MTNEEIWEKLVSVFARATDRRIQDVREFLRPESTFGDFGLSPGSDWVTVPDIQLTIEEELGIELSQERFELDPRTTMQDIVNMIREALDKKEQGAAAIPA